MFNRIVVTKLTKRKESGKRCKISREGSEKAVFSVLLVIIEICTIFNMVFIMQKFVFDAEVAFWRYIRYSLLSNLNLVHDGIVFNFGN